MADSLPSSSNQPAEPRLQFTVLSYMSAQGELTLNVRYENAAGALNLKPRMLERSPYKVSFDGNDVVVVITGTGLKHPRVAMLLASFLTQAGIIEAGLQLLDGKVYSDPDLEDSGQAYFCTHELPLGSARNALKTVLYRRPRG